MKEQLVSRVIIAVMDEHQLSIFVIGVIILTFLANTFGRLNKLSAVDQFIMVRNIAKLLGKTVSNNSFPANSVSS